MKKNFIKYLGTTTAIIGLGLLVADPAMAQGLNNVTNNIKSQMPGVVDVLSGVAYVGGVGFGIKAALKLKEHNESKGQTPLSQPITLGIVAALLLALPSFLQTAKQGVFGSGTQGTQLDGGSLRSINN